MKFLKTKNISKFSITDQSLIFYPSGVGQGNRVVINATGGLMLPKGRGPVLTDGVTPDPLGPDQRPKLTGVRQPTDAKGTIRYNTTTHEIEAYIGDTSPTWVVVASPVATAILKEDLGAGNGVETVFGPLNARESYLRAYTRNPDSIIVLVENVFQISGTNYDIVQNPVGKPSGWYLEFTSAVPASGGGGNPVHVTVYYGYAN